VCETTLLIYKERESECMGVREGVRKRECGGARLGRARQFVRFRTCVDLSCLSVPNYFFRYLALVFKGQVGGLLALLPCDQGPDLAVGHYHDEPRLLYQQCSRRDINI
jgi:hypothetical protein